MKNYEITDVYAREIIDSRGYPTVEAEVTVNDSIKGRASVPSGASTGSYEAVELRDGNIQEFQEMESSEHDKNHDIILSNRYHGKGVLAAITNVNTTIRDGLVRHSVFIQERLDCMMRGMDGTKNKGNLGANAILAVSLAIAQCGANCLGIPLYQYVGGISGNQMPVPMMNIINGGVHAKNHLDFQEFMIMPVGAANFRDGLRMGSEVYHSLKKLLEEQGKSTAVGDEGGFAPDVDDAFQVFEYLVEAIEMAGYVPGKDFVFAMDAAASELYEENSGMYYFPGETRALRTEHQDVNMSQPETPDIIRDCVLRSTDEMISYYDKLCEKYPIVSIEDGLQEEDWEGWKKLTATLGNKIQLVGDDLFVTNEERLKKGILEGAANSILVKVNQIGTLSEALSAIRVAKRAGYTTVMSHRSGETEDTSIADLAVAMNCGQIKTGAPARGERTCKYNRLLRIEEEIGKLDNYHSPFIR